MARKHPGNGTLKGHSHKGKPLRVSHMGGEGPNGNVTLLLHLPAGHPDKPEGGTMLVHVHPKHFVPDGH